MTAKRKKRTTKRGSPGSASPAAIDEVVRPAAAAPVTAAALPDPVGEAREVRGAAEAAMARGDLDAALERFAELRALAPDEPDGYLRAGGLLLRKMGRLDEAEEVLTAGVDNIPKHFALRTEHAFCAAQRGDTEAALRRYRWLTTVYPDNPIGYVGAGGVLRQAGCYAEADALVGTALERFPEDPRLNTVYAWIAHYAGDWPEALRRWHKVAVLLPDDPLAVFMAGVVLNRGLNRTAEADALLAGGMERFPDHVDIAAEHARTASAQGDWALALRRWQALVERFPAEPKVVAGRGEAEQQCQR